MRQLLKGFHQCLGICNSQGDINLVPDQVTQFEPVHLVAWLYLHAQKIFGTTNAARSPIITITTSSSIKVNPDWSCFLVLNIFIEVGFF